MTATNITVYPDGYLLYLFNGSWVVEAPDATTAQDTIKRGAELQLRHHRRTGSFK